MVLRGGEGKAGCISYWQPNWGMWTSLPGGSSFVRHKESWRAAEAWHCERPEEAIGEGAALVAVEMEGLKGPRRVLRALLHQNSKTEHSSAPALFFSFQINFSTQPNGC